MKRKKYFIDSAEYHKIDAVLYDLEEKTKELESEVFHYVTKMPPKIVKSIGKIRLQTSKIYEELGTYIYHEQEKDSNE